MSENMKTCPSCGELVPLEYVVCVWCGFDLTAEQIRRTGIKIGRREAYQRMVGMVRRPQQTAKEIALIPDLQGGKSLLYFLGLIITLKMLVVFGKLEGTIFNDSDAGFPLSSRFSLIITFRFIVAISFLIVQPVVLYLIFTGIWKLSARIILLLVRSVGGRGDLKKVRASIGYSLVPVFLGWALSTFFILFASKSSVGSGSSYSEISSAVDNITRSGIGLFSYILVLIGWIWTIVLMVITVRHAARLSVIESIVAAGIPTAIMMYIVMFGTNFGIV